MMNARTSVIAAVAAALLTWGVGTAVAATDAQGQGTTASVPAATHPHGHMNAEKWQQRQAKHAERLKQKLQLTDVQQPAWDAFQKAMAPQRHARLDRAEMKTLTTPERIDRMRAERQQRAAEADQRGDAIKTFYAQLTAEQQKVFDAQFMRGQRDGHHGKRHHQKRGHAAELAS